MPIRKHSWNFSFFPNSSSFPVPEISSKSCQTGPNRGCQRLLNSCSRAKTGLALLLGPRGSLPLKKANASPDPPPLSTQEAGEGRAPSPQHSRQTPRRDAQVAGEEHRRELTHLALERAHCLQRSYLEPRPYSTSRYCCSVGGLSLPVTRRTRTACLARLTTGRGGMR